jgi:membrane fusion protein, multidrug efflux system
MKHFPSVSRHLWAFFGLGILLGAATARMPARVAVRPATRPVPVDVRAATAITASTPTTVPAWRDALSLPGTVEGRTSEIRPAVDAVVSWVKCRTGQVVKRGDVLIQLDDGAARAQLAAAQAHYEEARAKAEALDGASDGAVPPSLKRAAMAEQKSAEAEVVVRQTALTETQIVAPMDGVVTRCDANPGDVVNRGTSLATVVQVDTVNVSVDVPQAAYPSLQVGQEVRIRSNALRAQCITGKVSFISVQFNRTTVTAVVKVAVTNAEGKLRPGMSVDVQILGSRAAAELAT